MVVIFRGRVLNTHPALLPRFGGEGMFGDHVFEAVLASTGSASVKSSWTHLPPSRRASSGSRRSNMRCSDSTAEGDAVKIPGWLRTAMVVVGVVPLVLVVTAWAALHYLSPMSRCDVHKFTPALWQDPKASQYPRAIRGCLVDDLTARTPIRGRSRADIVALLGEPPQPDYFREYDLVYWLGPERGLMSIDSEWLVMRLDSLGRVADFRLITD